MVPLRITWKKFLIKRGIKIRFTTLRVSTLRSGIICLLFLSIFYCFISGYLNVWTGQFKNHIREIFVPLYLTLGPVLMERHLVTHRQKSVQTSQILDLTRREMLRKLAWRRGSGGCIRRPTSPGQITPPVWIWTISTFVKLLTWSRWQVSVCPRFSWSFHLQSLLVSRH